MSEKRVIKEFTFRIVEGEPDLAGNVWVMLEWTDGSGYGESFLGVNAADVERFPWQAYISDQIRQQMMVLFNVPKDRKTRKTRRDIYAKDLKDSLTERLSVTTGRPTEWTAEDLKQNVFEAFRRIEDPSKMKLERTAWEIDKSTGEGLRKHLRNAGLKFSDLKREFKKREETTQ